MSQGNNIIALLRSGLTCGLLAAALVACGGGGGSSGANSVSQGVSVNTPVASTQEVPASSVNSSSSSSSNSAPANALSSGAITAFGSVFVNGHEFDTSKAKVIDDDTGATLSEQRDLEVGMVVSVTPSSSSTSATPTAHEIRVSPLLRGAIETNNVTAGTIQVLGQTVQISSATAYSDRRACVSASSAACAAVGNQASLTAGSFVAVHGYLFSAASGSAQVIATLISVQDVASQTYRLQGQVSSVSGTAQYKIGNETVDLRSAVCSNRTGTNTVVVSCASFAKVGDILTARSAIAPVGANFVAAQASLTTKAVETAGASVEVEGKVASVVGNVFVVNGTRVNGASLSASLIPAVGDHVEVLGTLANDGKSVNAISIKSKAKAVSSVVGLAGTISSVVSNSSTSYTIQVLGQSVRISASTHIADRSTSTRAAFNITNFASYVNARGASYAVVSSRVDASGTMQATSIDIVRAPSNGLAAVIGSADAPPVAGSPSSVTVRGIKLNYTSTQPSNASIAAGTVIVGTGLPSVTAGVTSINTSATGGSLQVIPARGEWEGGGDHRGF